MKRLFIIILLVLLTTSLYSEHVPKAESNFGLVAFKNIVNDQNYLAIHQEIILSPLSFKFYDNVFNLGVSLNSLSESTHTTNTLVPSSLAVSLLLGYERYINNNVSIAFDVGTGIGFITSCDSIYLIIGGNLASYYYFNKSFAIGGKINLYYNKLSYGAKIAVSAVYRFNGGIL